MQAAGNLGPLGPWQEKAPLSLVGVTLVGRVVSLLGTHEVSLLLCRFSHPAGPGHPAGPFFMYSTL